MPDPKYSWFVRVATNPMSIRTLSDDGKLVGRIIANHNDIVYHSVSYLKGMPGFLMIPKFNPYASQKDLPFIKLWPPTGLEMENIKPEVVKVTEDIDYDNDFDYEELDYEQVSVEDLADKLTNESNVINYSALEPYYEYLDDGRYWNKLTKDQLSTILEESNINTDLTARWDIIRLLKKTIREKLNNTQE